MLEKAAPARACRARLFSSPRVNLRPKSPKAFERYGSQHNRFSMALLIGGVSFDEQDKKLDRGVDMLIATPGRLLDHFGRGKLMLNAVRLPRHRRSRPHARHGVHSRHRTHLQASAPIAADAFLLGDDAARNPAPHRAVPAQSGADRSQPLRHDGDQHHPGNQVCVPSRLGEARSSAQAHPR